MNTELLLQDLLLLHDHKRIGRCREIVVISMLDEKAFNTID